MPGPDTREGFDDTFVDSDEEEIRAKPAMSTILYNAPVLNDYIASGTFITTDRDTFFTLLSDIEYVVNFYTREMLLKDDKFVDALAQYDAAKEKYDQYQQKSEATSKGINSIVGGLVGFKTEPAQEETPAE